MAAADGVSIQSVINRGKDDLLFRAAYAQYLKEVNDDG